MKRFIVNILCIVCLASFCFFLVACDDKNEFEKLEAEGNVIAVTYNPNGGKFYNLSGVTLIDMFNPKNCKAQADGKLHIKLLDPTSEQRPLFGDKKITFERSGYFCVGWYQTRKPVEKVIENVTYALDEEGNALLKNDDGTYYVKYQIQSDGTYKLYESENEFISYPDYTYENPWDFETDELVLDPTVKDYDLELYAAWVNYFSVEYYFVNDGKTTLVDGGFNFDYKTANSGNEKYSDLGTVYFPYWENDVDGKKPLKMTYSHELKDGTTRSFPKVDGYEFKAAYLDEACTQPITESFFNHTGSIDKEKGTAVNPVQRIYFTGEKGRTFNIYSVEDFEKAFEDETTATMLSANYAIHASSLTFTEQTPWPAVFTTGDFKGSFMPVSGNLTVNGIAVKATNVRRGGVFGSIAKTAVIKNVDFKNVKVTLDVNGRVTNGVFGMLAGKIEAGADVSVSVSGMLEIMGETAITTGSKGNATVYLVALCEDKTDLAKITQGDLTLRISGTTYTEGEYRYKINFNEVEVDEYGNIVYETKLQTIKNDVPYYDVKID